MAGKNANPYYGKINPYEPSDEDLDMTKIQSYLAEDVYVDLVEREWKHRRRETTPEGDVVKVGLHDGSTAELKVLGDYDKQQGYHDGFQASLYYDKENNRLHFAFRGTVKHGRMYGNQMFSASPLHTTIRRLTMPSALSAM